MSSPRVAQRLEKLRSLTKRSNTPRRFVSEFPSKEFEAWTHVDINKLERQDTLIARSVHNYIMWCQETCQDEFVMYRKIIYFKNPTDAAYFLVVWQ